MTAARRFPVIVGPTAGGKTALAVQVAHAIGGEVVTADSVQIYRGLDIGSAKPNLEEREGVPHHLLDIAEPDAKEPFSVSDWLLAAERAIAAIQGRGKVPVVVGGTHMYVKAFLEGLFEGPGADEGLREELRQRPLEELRSELVRVDPVAAARIHANDQRRTIRALEVFRLTGTPITQLQTQWDQAGVGERGRGDCVLVGLDWPTDAINRRINERVRGMMERGLEAEARGLWRAGRLGVQAREALGYKQLIEWFEGRGTLEEAVEEIKICTRGLGKSQRTWLKRLRTTPGSVWIDAGAVSPAEWAGIVVGAMGTT
ncbi:MAG: tRNA (adenosine(37)-N6)-dimethylallyltransferase MiaA [Planctomycetota bacterium]